MGIIGKVLLSIIYIGGFLLGSLFLVVGILENVTMHDHQLFQ